MRIKVIALAAFAVVAAPAAAHHSGAMFDRSKETRLDGTIKEFGWNNPHSWIYINAPDDKGEIKEWAIEMGSPSSLARGGWTRTTLKPGDKAVVTIHPLRSGAPGGTFVSVTLADGRTLGERRTASQDD